MGRLNEEICSMVRHLLLDTFFLLSFLLFLVACSSQKPTSSGPSKKLPPPRSNQPAFVSDEMIKEKIAKLEKEHKTKPTDESIILDLAAAYLDIQQIDKASYFLELLVQLPSKNAKVYSSLSNIYKTELRLDEALMLMEKFVELSKDSPDVLNQASKELAVLQNMKQIKDRIYHVDLIALPSPINSANHEYLPQFSIDQQSLVFTRRLFGQEDLFEVIYQDGFPPKIRPIEELNSDENEGAHCLSADGQALYFTRCNKEFGYGKCDIYMSRRKDDQWSPPANLGSAINSEHWESQPSLAANGQVLYFSSNRPESLGGSDIYFSVKKGNGQWSLPINAGTNINTKGNEGSPFIHPDGKTLYFQSDGHSGLGSQDLFVSRYDEVSGWSMPTNLGFPINTGGSEGALVVSLDGTKGFYATDRIGKKTLGSLDLVEFVLPIEFRPEPMTFVKGRVTDVASLLPLQSTVRIVSLSKNDTLFTVETNYNGEFLTAVPLGQSLAIHIENEGYLFYSEHISYETVRVGAEPYLFAAAIEKIPVNEDIPTTPIVLRNIFFESNSAALLPISALEIDYLVSLLRSYQDKKIEIIGHTDNTGNTAMNAKLSLERAESVKNALLAEGISGERIFATGKGEIEPIADNNTPEGREKNRRTEFRIISSQ